MLYCTHQNSREELGGASTRFFESKSSRKRYIPELHLRLLRRIERLFAVGRDGLTQIHLRGWIRVIEARILSSREHTVAVLARISDDLILIPFQDLCPDVPKHQRRLRADPTPHGGPKPVAPSL